ncbi:hypothetical protein VNO78_02110 [Psophocarpus tetragonolobus]|uniref:Uncharacterized protein n=1 Tax=Psophocarpus tetragonolobus TaxID=3891 RepID=A0AAN9T2C3_PSOTE
MSFVSGPGPYLNESAVNNKKKHNGLGRNIEKKAKVQDIDNDVDIQEPVVLDAARNSFSLAIKECQDETLRSEALLKNAQNTNLGPISA